MGESIGRRDFVGRGGGDPRKGECVDLQEGVGVPVITVVFTWEHL